MFCFIGPYLVSPNLGTGSHISPIIRAARIKSDHFRPCCLVVGDIILVVVSFILIKLMVMY
jgi:hypothetical protein